MSLVSNTVAVLCLYQLTLLVLKNRNIALLSACLYTFSPSSIFFQSSYSESLFTMLQMLSFLTFFGSYLRAPRENLFRSWRAYSFVIVPSLISCLSVFARSTGMFSLVVFGYPILGDFIAQIRAMMRPDKKLRLQKLGPHILWGAYLVLVLVTPYLMMLVFAKNIYCGADRPPSWCQAAFPNIYDYI